MRILVADDHEVILQGLKTILESHPGWVACAQAQTGRQAVEAAVGTKLDVAVLDTRMSELYGVDAARQIRREPPFTEILILTTHQSDQILQPILLSGAKTQVLKSDAAKDLSRAIETAASHAPFVSADLSSRVRRNSSELVELPSLNARSCNWSLWVKIRRRCRQLSLSASKLRNHLIEP